MLNTTIIRSFPSKITLPDFFLTVQFYWLTQLLLYKSIKSFPYFPNNADIYDPNLTQANMVNYQHYKTDMDNAGFAVIPEIYIPAEVTAILSEIVVADTHNDTFRKTNDLFAIRQCVKEIPGLLKIVCNEKLYQLIAQLFGDGYFITKSIYFDKPSASNWL